VLRGALVEYGLSLPPLFVVFQFNPEKLTRSRSITYSAPKVGTDSETSLRRLHGMKEYSDLAKLRDAQHAVVQEEVIGLELRLDACDKLDEGDVLAEQFGISPALSTLELMVHPKGESLLGQALDALLGQPPGYKFSENPNPPLTLFVFGRKRVLPVNITSLNVTELMYAPDLNPIRATVALSLTVIEGVSAPYLYSKAMKEAMSVLNLADAPALANVVVPG
jgi:hypothetical protein